MTNFDYFDEQMFAMAHRIERHGFTTMAVNTGDCSVPGCPCLDDPGPTWTYSIGMLEHDHPEVVVVGAPLALSYDLIDRVFEWHRVGRSLPCGRDDHTTSAGAKFTTVPVPDRCWRESDLMACWHDYYQSVGWPSLGNVDNAVVQLVLADDNGRFPWDDGCDADLVHRQPIIDDDDSAWSRTDQR